MDEDKVMSLADGLVRIRKFSEEFYEDYSKSPENKLALSKTLLVEAAICFLSDVMVDPSEEEAKLALEAAHRTAMLLNEIKEEIVKQKRRTTNWSN